MVELVAASDLPAAAAGPLTPGQRLRAIVGGSAGNLVEWYDWFAYASFSLYFAPVFFPDGDPTAQLLKTAAVFAVGFFARPLGAWLLGRYADRRGRRAALTLSVALMCLGSLAIALAPGYAVIGAAAPVVLLLARLLQGLSVGGEYGASATYLSEMAGRDARGFWSSFQYVTLIMGQLLALSVLLLLQAVLPAEALESWAWRIPFFVGAGLAVVVFWLRRGIAETPAFEHAQGERGRTLTLFRRYPKETAYLAVLTAGGSLSFYAYTTYMQKFLVGTSGFTKDQATQIMTGALFCFMAVQPLFGWVSDRVGRKPMLIGSFGLGALGAWPIFTAIAEVQTTGAAFGLVLLPLLILSAYTSVGAIIKAELFPAHIRALGVALPYALANAAFGGTAEYAALSFKGAGAESGFYLYVAAMLAAGLLVAIALPDTQKVSLIEDD